MINIIIQKFKEQFRSIIYYFVGLFVYAWMIVGLYPSISTVKADYLQQMPENLIKFFGADTLAITKFEGFMSMEFLSLFFILIIAFFIGSSAGSTIAGAIERKTIEFQLSQPISRTKLVLSETFVSLFYLATLVWSISLSIFAFCKLYHIDVKDSGLLAFSITATAFLWAVYGISLLISSMLKTKITVATATVSVTMAFYIFTAMTNMVEKLKNYDKLSLFYMYNPQKLLETGTVDWFHIEILLGILILGLISSLIIFNNKDL